MAVVINDVGSFSGGRNRQKNQGRPAFVEPGDIEAAMRTAAAIGDDTLQRKATGHVVPDAFTHGSAEQRQRWFQTGFSQGTVNACNTFSAAALCVLVTTFQAARPPQRWSRDAKLRATWKGSLKLVDTVAPSPTCRVSSSSIRARRSEREPTRSCS